MRLTTVLKPCYVYAPRRACQRIFHKFFPPMEEQATVKLPWGVPLDVKVTETVGREIFKQGVFDIGVSELAWRLLSAGDRILDVGANIGYMTSLFAIRAGPTGLVHSFEPHPGILPLLKRNLTNVNLTGRAAEVILHACALGESSGPAQLVESDSFQWNEGSARVRSANDTGQEGRAHTVEVKTLDALFPDETFILMKIDVEGFEASVLRGARQMLAQRRIKHIIYEDASPKTSDLAETLTGFGYQVRSIGYGLRGLILRELNESPALDDSWESQSYLATMAPEETAKLLKHKGWKVLRV